MGTGTGKRGGQIEFAFGAAGASQGALTYKNLGAFVDFNINSTVETVDVTSSATEGMLQEDVAVGASYEGSVGITARDEAIHNHGELKSWYVDQLKNEGGFQLWMRFQYRVGNTIYREWGFYQVTELGREMPLKDKISYTLGYKLQSGLGNETASA